LGTRKGGGRRKEERRRGRKKKRRRKEGRKKALTESLGHTCFGAIRFHMVFLQNTYCFLKAIHSELKSEGFNLKVVRKSLVPRFGILPCFT
jgi:hypothetical protein